MTQTDLVMRYAPTEYGFKERMALSQGISDQKDFAQILIANIPAALAVQKASNEHDRQGTDYWITRKNGGPLSVDVKVRLTDFAYKCGKNQADDLALEYWSVQEARVVGWTLDQRKMTDYIMWYWADSGRWCLMPFPLLSAVFAQNVTEWVGEYRKACQKTTRADGSHYHSWCVFVPRNVVWMAIQQRFGGVVA